MSSSILDNIYCISLEENEDRRENIMKNFPFTINFFKAVNTRKERILQYKHLIDKKSWKRLEETNSLKQRNYHHNLTNGAVGCFLSHIQILKYIVKHKIPYSLILEDDSEPIISNVETYLTYIINKIPLDCDVLFLNYLSIRYTDLNSYLIDNEFIEPKYRNSFKLFCTDSLIVSYEGAKKILENFTTVKIQYDSFLCKLFRESKIKIYLVKKKYLKQSGFGSTVQNVWKVVYPKIFDYNKI
jgi:GR25 family glycosyltransferase involved in LPS biosynthesis